MRFEVYCDESHPDIFWSKSASRACYCLISGLWLPAEQRQPIKDAIGALKREHGFSGEVKWHKAHTRFEEFYKGLVDLYLHFNTRDMLWFRCIAVEAKNVNLVRFHDSDAELGFYKFYYQMLVHWILDFNEYSIFCDEKTNRVRNRLKTLSRVLGYANVTSRILSVQALPSKQLALLQLSDFLLGMASSRMNNSVRIGTAKDRIIRHLEQRLGMARLSPTPKSNTRFNIFKINLQGGW